jgi:hypothetical protein
MLFSSFPRATQQALRMFDAAGRGEFPRFRGGFTCDVQRPQGLDQHWNVVTHIRLDDAAGAMVAFPYPMSGVSGNLTVTDDRVIIERATMQRDGASLVIDGDVTWHDPEAHRKELEREAALAAMSPGERMQSLIATTMPAEDKTPPLRPELRVTAKNVPIDEKLLSALPEDQRAWLKKLGIAGRFDLDGRVMPATQPTPTDSDIGFEFKIDLHDGSAWPNSGTFAASNLSGQMRLTPGRIEIASLRGKRGDADLSASGTVSWGESEPRIAIEAAAKNLALDPALYAMLPAVGRGAWDQVQPQGTLDASMSYSGAVGDSPAGAATQPSNGAGAAFQLVLTPRQLSATPAAVPYKLDNLAGSVTVLQDRIVLSDMSGRHGDASVKFSATGDTSSSAATRWDFRLTGENMVVDDA